MLNSLEQADVVAVIPDVVSSDEEPSLARIGLSD
jgi:hypothetical protein